MECFRRFPCRCAAQVPSEKGAHYLYLIRVLPARSFWMNLRKRPFISNGRSAAQGAVCSACLRRPRPLRSAGMRRKKPMMNPARELGGDRIHFRGADAVKAGLIDKQVHLQARRFEQRAHPGFARQMVAHHGRGKAAAFGGDPGRARSAPERKCRQILFPAREKVTTIHPEDSRLSDDRRGQGKERWSPS